MSAGESDPTRREVIIAGARRSARKSYEPADHRPPELEGPVGSETRNGMGIDWDVPLPMDDGLILRAALYRPIAEGRYPVIMSYGTYAKLLHFEDGYVTARRKMVDEFPDVLANSSNRYQQWEVVDPEKWVPDMSSCASTAVARAVHSPSRDMDMAATLEALIELREGALSAGHRRVQLQPTEDPPRGRRDRRTDRSPSGRVPSLPVAGADA